MSKQQLLSVIVPAYGEEGTIVEDLKNLENTLKEIRFDYEIIVVVDGRLNSSDKTYERAKTLSSKNISVYTYNENKGKGYAVRFGMAKSQGDLVAFIDAGMEISPNSLSLALEHFKWYEADIIIGSKRHPASKVNYPPIRRILSMGYQYLTRFLFGLNVKDTQVGMKIFRREVLEDVLPRLLVKRYAFDVEILAVSHALGYKRIFEAPVELSYNFDSLVNSASFKQIYPMLWDTLAVYYRLNILRYYSKKNMPKWKYDKDLVFKNSEKLKIPLSKLKKITESL